MGQANIYLLLPESERNSNIAWALTSKNVTSEEEYQHFINNKVDEINTIAIENYQGFYDSQNVSSFFEDLEIFDNEYPKAKRRFQRKVQNWYNWRDQQQQISTQTYEVYGQIIESHTLAEIAQHKQNNPDDTYVLLNNKALCIGKTPITVKISGQDDIDIDFVVNRHCLQLWFSNNRQPARKFHVIPKHGESGKGNWSNASVLMCSASDAQELLNKAVGKTIKQLFNFDAKYNMYIVFWHENEPNNQYHAYHLPLNTNEIPNDIKQKLKPEKRK